MKKIVELRIDQEDLEFEGLGVDIMSLVDQPAIGIDWMAFNEEDVNWYVDNKGFEKFDKWFNDNQDIFKKPGLDQTAQGGTNHKEQMEKLEEMGIEAGFPLGYCFQVAQFLFYAVGGYKSDWELQCIKKMEIPVGEIVFQTSHWYIKHKETHRIVDLTASQFDGMTDINDWYSKGNRANLGFSWYNVNGEKVYFEDPVPSLQSLKMYDKWREEYGKLEVLETYYQACQYEELRKKFSSEEEMVHQMIIDLASSDEFGEEYDNDCVIINGTQDNFTTIGDWAKGVIGLDILGKKIDKNTSETKYRYAGPMAERNFCRAMQRLQKLYTWEELKEMGQRVGNGMPVYGSAAFNLIDWKGGPNCKHFWEEVQVFKQDGRSAMMISKGPASGQMGRTPANSPNNGYKMSFQFADEDQRIIVGPAMIPQQLIARRDALGNIFHVYFTKETIKKIAEKFLRENKHNNTDVNHDDDVTTDNTLLESWIVEDTQFDKSAKYGYNLPEGAWMVSYKINDEETWQKIKRGEIKGFSVAGNFIEKAIKKTNE